MPDFVHDVFSTFRICVKHVVSRSVDHYDTNSFSRPLLLQSDAQQPSVSFSLRRYETSIVELLDLLSSLLTRPPVNKLLSSLLTGVKRYDFHKPKRLRLL